jgi:hypothetical protein
LGSGDPLLLQHLPCAGSILLEACAMQEVDEIFFDVIQKPAMCFIDEDDAEDIKYEELAIQCATSNYLDCKNN